MENIRLEETRCNLCGLCIPVCVRRILTEGEESVRVTDPSRCILCGHCKAVCPENAPEIPSLDEEEFEPVPPKERFLPADELMAFFRSRRSVRVYRKKPVEREKLEQIIQAGRFAPTGGNRQPLHYLVVHTPQRLKAVRDLTLKALVEQAARIEEAFEEQRKRGTAVSDMYQNRDIYIEIWRNMMDLHRQGVDRLFYHAPAVIVCHADIQSAVTPIADAGLAAMQMVLMAHALGLGTCFCGFLAFAIDDSVELRESLGVPQGHSAPLAFMVGYPDVHYIKLISRNPARVRWI